MASGWFGSKVSEPARAPDVRVQVADQKPHEFYLQPGSGSSNTSSSSRVGTTYVDRTHSKTHVHSVSLFDIGILKDTLIPSLTLHSGLAVIAYGAARYTQRVEAKDWLWPSGQVANAWWSAIGRRLAAGLTVSQAFNRLSWHERVMLTGVTLWGGRLFYRVARRSIERGKDDPRYDEAKKEEGFWNNALFKVFIPEAFFQMLISLPFTAPFRHEGAVMMGYHPFIQMFAVGLFSSGLALETLADYQLDQYKAEGGRGILREGVWSLVRNPKYVSRSNLVTDHLSLNNSYLGDALVHISFIVMLYGSDMLAPIELLGPIANYAFLRFFGGDAEKEKHSKAKFH
jgi:steroid 5-alpha reductase family enzyme